YCVPHQLTFVTVMRLSDLGETIDVITVTIVLNDRKQLDEAGVVSYLTDIAESVATTVNIEYYSEIVEDKSMLRRLVRAATDIVTTTYAREDEVEDVLNEAEKAILEVSG